jgi:O-antigen ligase
MLRNASRPPHSNVGLSFWLLSTFLVVLWLAGGASRADVLGQAVTRFFAWMFLVAVALSSTRLDWRRVKPIAALLGLSVLVVSIQLVPLPPAIWTALPGRELLTRAAEVSGQQQPWRPLSLSPSGTANALGSLVVPVTTMVLAANLTRKQHWQIAGLVLGLTVAGSAVALLQFSGAHFDNPLINYIKGSVSGNFANRNHFALFVALGCLIAPAWGFRRDRKGRWKAIAAVALLPFFLLVILATGSRTGMLLSGLAIVGGLFIVRTNVLRELRSLPRWMAVSIVGTTAVALIGAIVLSIALGRAVSIDRAIDLQAADDLRSRALPYVVDAIMRYFPVGSGFGTFDPVYRIGEPDALLQPAYFNHAHNDWLEIVLEGGIAGAALLLGALCWGLLATARLWRNHPEGATLGYVGALALVLTMLASIPDYPARTPMMMAIVVIASLWLHLGSRPTRPKD